MIHGISTYDDHRAAAEATTTIFAKATLAIVGPAIRALISMVVIHVIPQIFHPYISCTSGSKHKFTGTFSINSHAEQCSLVDRCEIFR